MFRVASWFIILAPIVGLYMEGRIRFFTALIFTAIVWGWCGFMAMNRPANRTPIHTILVRIILTAWVPFGFFMWWIQSDGGVPRIFTFWETCYASFGGAVGFIALVWTFFALGRRAWGQGDAQLNHWEGRGGHYFWDMIPWPWNPDPAEVRNGGGGWVEQHLPSEMPAPPSTAPRPTSTSVPQGFEPVQTRRRTS